jgi:hypothetical protein
MSERERTGARELTGASLIAALGGLAARPSVRAVLKQRADELAARIAEKAGAEVATVEDAPGGVHVVARGAGLFAREYGSADAPPDPVIAPAIAELRR